MDFKRGETLQGYFFSNQDYEDKNHGSYFLRPFNPGHQRFILEMKSYHWTLAALKDINVDIY